MTSGSVLRLVETQVNAPLQQGNIPSLSQHHLLLVDDGSNLINDCIVRLRQAESRILVLQSDPISRSAPIISIELQKETHWPLIENTIKRIFAVSDGILGILFFNTETSDQLELVLQRLYLAIAVAKSMSLATDPPAFFLFIHGHEGILAEGLDALISPLRLELPKLSFRSIHLDLTASDPLDCLLQELTQMDDPYYTTHTWEKTTRKALTVQESAPVSPPLFLSSTSTVVFAGGARGIGAICAQALVKQVPCRILFLGRTPLSAEAYTLSQLSTSEQQDQSRLFINAYKSAHPTCSPKEPREAWNKLIRAAEAVNTIRTLESQGADVKYYALDVRDPLAVKNTFDQIQSQYGCPDLIVHVAGLGGVETDRMLSRKEWTVIQSVIETKVIGAQNLLAEAKSRGVNLFIGFGSIASRFGNSGQVDYASANALLTGLVKAHNRSGSLPVARVIAWGAWDDVGMAVTGPTKDRLQAYGLQFIAPTVGGSCFLAELSLKISATTPEVVYLTPTWPALQEILEKNVRQTQDRPPKTYPLLGQVVERIDNVLIRAEHWLDPKQIPFLDHHRYDGTAWVPAVMGMEIAVEAAAEMLPKLQPFALQDITLRKAVRLVRDEPILLKTEARIYSQKDKSQKDKDAQVYVVISAEYKGRSWVFAEMRVRLTEDPTRIQEELKKGLDSLQKLDPNSSTLCHRSRVDLYPSEWLKYQTYGSTFQVIEYMRMDPTIGQAEGELINTANITGCQLPLTLIDGILQSYGVLLSTLLESWCGPPLGIGEICWDPKTAQVQRAHFRGWAHLEDKLNFPLVYLMDQEGTPLLRMQRANQGGTGLKHLTQQVKTYQEKSLPPYLGQITLHHPWLLKTEQILDPQYNPFLSDYPVGQLGVPAAYLLEVAVESAAHLNPSATPIELKDIDFPCRLHSQGMASLSVEARILTQDQVQVTLYSEQNYQLNVHATLTVVCGSRSDSLGSRNPHSFKQSDSDQIQTRHDLYPYVFPRGLTFQVIEKMRLDPQRRVAIAHLKANTLGMSECWLPIPFVDGILQVYTATQKEFQKSGATVKTIGSIRWLSPWGNTKEVLCCQDSSGKMNSFSLIDPDHRLLLAITDITLTHLVLPVSPRSIP
jgi:NAD(P)-dependent dehydrogenase (short-subunit alcohol dehydrogenase family)